MAQRNTDMSPKSSGLRKAFIYTVNEGKAGLSAFPSKCNAFKLYWGSIHLPDDCATLLRDRVDFRLHTVV